MRTSSLSGSLFFVGLALAVPVLTGANGSGCGNPVVIGGNSGGSGGGGTACPVAGETWDPVTQQCVNPGGPGQTGGAGGGTPVCPTGETWDPTTDACVNPGGPPVTTSSSSSSGTSSSSSSSTSSSGSTGCVGSVDVTVGGMPAHFTSDCATDTWNPGGATTALGYLFEGGPAPGVSDLEIYGCVSTAAGSQGISISVPGVTAPGTFGDGSASYTLSGGGGTFTNTGSLNVVVTTLGATGDTIEGTFSGALFDPPTTLTLDVSGSFTVCHIKDELTP
jgi:hypothetical protein